MELKPHFASLLFWATAVFGDVIRQTGTITLTSQDIAPDGFARSASLVNGKHPGPVITANKGEQIKINVVNNLSDPNQMLGASIHWHGLFQRSTNFMDGVVGVTQCPISPGHEFEYSFGTSPAAGTFWYHSHFDVQYCDGVRGVLIVYDPDDPLKDMYDVDDENTIISLTEWFHSPAPDIRNTPTYESTLINGIGRFVDGPKVDLAVVNVEQGKRYRFRLIGMSCDADFKFSIDGHDLTVIETEGTENIPVTVNTIPIQSGQRYSFVLNANQTVDNYWIRSLPDGGDNGLSRTFEGGVNSAILRYKGAEVVEPTTQQQKNRIVLDEADLHPYFPRPVPGDHTPDGADETFTFTTELDVSDPVRLKWSFNNTPFVHPDVPILLQILTGTPPQDLLPNGTVYTVERNKTVQVNIPAGLIGGAHPYHLHGHEFWVVKSADSDDYNFDDPIVRDTVSGGLDASKGYFAIRFRTDNPGPWIVHCHLDFHLRDGLAFVFVEAPGDTDSANPNRPQAWEDLCPIWDSQHDSVKNAGYDKVGLVSNPGWDLSHPRRARASGRSR